MPKPKSRPSMRQSREWYSLRNSAADAVEVYIYDEIGYWGTTASDLVAALSELRGVTAIDLHLNSPGGDVFDGLAIMNCLRAHPATVTTYVDGIAASIASVIAMAGDRIVMGPHSQLMIHDASGLCLGNADDMREMGATLDFQSDNIAGVYAEKAGGTVADWRTQMTAETWYTADEAVAAGLADEVAQRPAQVAAGVPMDKAWDLTVFNFAGREKAPAPAVTKTEPVTAQVQVDGAVIAEDLLEPQRRLVKAQLADGEHVLSQDDVKAAAAAPAPVVPVKPALTINVAEALDAETLEALKAAVRDRGAAAAVAEFGVTFTDETVPAGPVGTGQDGTAAGQEPPPAPEPAAPATPEAPEDLLVVPAEEQIPAGGRVIVPSAEPAAEPEVEEAPAPDDSDPWAALTAHLTTPTAASTEDLLAALREASL